MVSMHKAIFISIFLFKSLILSCPSYGQDSLVRHDRSLSGGLNQVDSLLANDQNELARSLLDSMVAWLPNANLEGQILYHKLNGDYYLSENLYNQAVDAYEPLISISTGELGEAVSLKYARAINDLGIAYMKIGRYDEAIRAHLKSQVIYDQFNDPQGGSYNFNNIAVIYTKLKKIDSALYFHSRSLAYAKQAKDTLGIGFNLMNMGILHIDDDDLVKGLSHLQQSLAVFEQQKDEGLVNAVNRRIANYYTRVKDYEMSLKTFREVLAYYQKKDSRSGQGGTHVQLGELYLQMDELDSAIDHIEKSVVFYEPSGYANGLAKACKLRGDYWFEKKELTQAKKNYEKVLEYTQNNIKGMSMIAMMGIAKVELERRNYQRAIDLITEGLEIVNYSASAGNLGGAYNVLYKAYKGLGNDSKAIEYLEKYFQEKDKIFDEDQMIQFARIEYQNQLAKEESEREIAQTIKDAEVARRLTKERWMTYMFISTTVLVFIIASFVYRAYRIKKTSNQELNAKNQELTQLRESEKQLSSEAIASKERELATMAMATHEKNALLKDLDQKVSFIESRMGDEMKASLKEMRKTISDSFSLDDSWDSFMHKFEGVHPQFFDKLKEENPVLTIDDLKLSAYLKIGMSNKEIANVTHLTLGSVKSKINRLKKKLEMGPDDSVRDFMLKYA